MKKRRTVIVAFLLCAIMAIGVGFATISDNISIGGHLTSGAEDFKVFFTAAQTTGTVPVGVTVKFDDQDSLSGVRLKETGFTVVGINDTTDTVTVQYTIHNYNAFPMYITPSLLTVAADGTSTPYTDANPFIVTASSSLITLAANTDATYTITVQLRQAMDVAQSTKIKVNFAATSTNPNP